MAIRVIDDTKLNNIAVAIQAKDSGDQMTVDEMVGRINALEIARPPVEEKDINFYDYNRQLLYSYTFSEAENLSALPELPNRDKLTCDGWNYSLSTVKEYALNKRPIDAGAIYHPTDNAIHYFINFAEYQDLTVTLNDVGSTSIDWGDGTIDNLTTHTYSTIGSYEIKEHGLNIQAKNSPALKLILTEVWISNNSIVFGGIFDDFPFIKYAIMPSNIRFSGSIIFRNCASFAFFVFPLWEDCSSYFCYGSAKLQGVSLPETFLNISGKNFFRTSISRLCFPKHISNIGDECCYGLITKEVILPDDLTIIQRSAFRMCNQLISVTIPNKVTQIYDYAFDNCSMLKIIDLTKFDDPTSIPTLGGTHSFTNIASNAVFYAKNQEMYGVFTAATNWSTYASKFVIKGA